MSELVKKTAELEIREYLKDLSKETITPDNLLKLKTLSVLIGEFNAKIDSLILSYLKDNKEVGNYYVGKTAPKRSAKTLTPELLSWIKKSDYDLKDLANIKLKSLKDLDDVLASKDKEKLIKPAGATKDKLSLK